MCISWIFLLRSQKMLYYYVPSKIKYDLNNIFLFYIQSLIIFHGRLYETLVCFGSKKPTKKTTEEECV